MDNVEVKEENGVREVRHYHYHRGGSFLGSVLVLLGALFVLRELQVVPYFTLLDIARFWPVLLILLGFSLLRRGFWSVLLELLVLALIIFGIAKFWNAPPDNFRIFMERGGWNMMQR